MQGEPLWSAHWLALLGSSFHILVIWLLAALVLRSMRRVLALLQGHIEGRHEGAHGGSRDPRRIETLAGVFHYTSTIVVLGLAAMLTLDQVGISITPILATAGVAGIAIGFGAQSLVKDFFSGLFLLIENQVNEGDCIDVAGKSGYVERVTLRHIRMRDYDGSVHFIPNGMITTVTNHSREYVYAVVDLPVPRSRDLEQVMHALQAAAVQMQADGRYTGAMLGALEIAGVEKLDADLLTLRCRIKAIPLQQARVRREFLRRAQLALDRPQAGAEAAP
jgi:small-conductance mechanosensitive channel